MQPREASEPVVHGSPAVSDTGAVVVYVASTPPADPSATGVNQVWIRDRVADTVRSVAELGAAAPAVSGDGCTVAYVVTGDVTQPAARLTIVDRCAAERSGPLPIGRTIDTVATAVGADAAPALSFDGSTIVWSTGDEIRRYVRTGPGDDHRLVDAFDADPTPTVEVRTGPAVDVSDDGRTVVFEAGPGSTPFDPDVANVYLWSQPDAGLASIDALSVTPSGVPGAEPSGSPTISADGMFVSFGSQSVDLVAVDGQPVTVPYVAIVDRSANTMRVIAENATFPVLSDDATHVVYERDAALWSATFAEDGSVIDTEIVAAAEPVGAVATSRHARWVAFATSAPLVGDGDGIEIVAVDLRPGTDEDVLDTTTTSSTTTTTTTTSPTTTTTTAPTSPTTTVGARTEGDSATPVSTRPSRPPVAMPFPVPRRPPASRGGVTFAGSDGSAAFVGATATPLSFEPTVVEAGRRTGTSTLTVGRATGVTSVAIGTGPFAVTADACSGQTLGPGASCTVEVDFRPDTIGPTAGSLTFQFTDGSVVSAALDGVGAAAPTLDPVPAVAAPGQVVTVFGAGFPPGVVVDLQRGTERSQVAVDADGTFADVLVVPVQAPSGPMELSVTAQPDRFADVVGELLVSSRSLGSGSAAFRGSVVSGLRR